MSWKTPDVCLRKCVYISLTPHVPTALCAKEKEGKKVKIKILKKNREEN